MKRRDFLKSSSAVSLPILLNGFGLGVLPQMAALSGLEGTDKILILIQLNGGNDGLNTVIPLASYDNLAGYRGNILIPENQILQIDETVGFHPAMMDMYNMYQDGKIHVVEGVAYPNQNRSHFRSTDIWSTGSEANEFLTTGWMGRYFQNIAPEFPDNYPNSEYPDPFALTIGSLVSETCQGVTTNFSLALNDPAALAPLTEAEIGELPNTNYGAELAYLIDAIAQTNAYSEVILAAADAGTNMSELYSDDNRLAQQLRTVA
ncbi:MAG: hypothetical protein HKN67_05545, partial [Saprospiraceae bacterium]|nr:hypothetical protein [Saprospiraceae bacterium]